MDFEDLYRSLVWVPIPGCPGRYRLSSAPRAPSIRELAKDYPARAFRVPAARDEVFVVRFEDGAGLISYRRPDGSFRHTLNTAEGFARKLDQLGIALAEP
jgi:hypothetical protein